MERRTITFIPRGRGAGIVRRRRLLSRTMRPSPPTPPPPSIASGFVITSGGERAGSGAVRIPDPRVYGLRNRGAYARALWIVSMPAQDGRGPRRGGVARGLREGEGRMRVIKLKEKRRPHWRTLVCRVCHAAPAKRSPDGSCANCHVHGSLVRGEYSVSCVLR
jgi:hypothetical protein